MIRTSSITTALVAALALLAGASASAQTLIDQNKALAGNITPGDTPGFPVTISQPGSYKLTSNLNVPAYTTGVLITAPNVTLDLNGFAIQGPNSCTRNGVARSVACTQGDESTRGINALGTTGTVLRNGVVQGFAFAGVGLGGASRADGLSVSHNAVGIQALADQGTGAVVQSSVVTMNAIYGVVLLGGMLSNSRVSNSGHVCVSGGGGALVTESAVSGCQFGIDQARIRGVLLLDHGTTFGLGVVSMGGNNSGGNGNF